MRLVDSSVYGWLTAAAIVLGTALSPVAHASTDALKSPGFEAPECSTNCILTITTGNTVTAFLTMPNGKRELVATYDIPESHSDFRKFAQGDSEIRLHTFEASPQQAGSKVCGGYDGWGWGLFELIGEAELPGGTIITSIYIGAGQQLVTTEYPNGGGSSEVEDAPKKQQEGCTQPD